MPSIINEMAVAEIKGIVDANTSMILIDPTGLKAAESLAFRKALHEAGATVRQAKARLVRRVLPEDLQNKVEGGGSLALIAGEDIAAAAKLVNDLAKDDQVALRAGFVEGKALDAKAAKALADLPTKHEARAMVARALRAPYVKLAKIAKAPYRRLARALTAHKEKQE